MDPVQQQRFHKHSDTEAAGAWDSRSSGTEVLAKGRWNQVQDAEWHS